MMISRRDARAETRRRETAECGVKCASPGERESREKTRKPNNFIRFAHEPWHAACGRRHVWPVVTSALVREALQEWWLVYMYAAQAAQAGRRRAWFAVG